MQSKARFINLATIDTADTSSFASQNDFPYVKLQEFLTPQGFEMLYDQFPSLNLFGRHSNIQRVHGQRPHDRYYLAYKRSIYHQTLDEKGLAVQQSLPDPWQQFLQELENCRPYWKWVKSLLGGDNYSIRYSWHIGFKGCEVSPHLDAPSKLATHLLYFNTSQDWNPSWGGSTIILDEKMTPTLNPDFDDFENAIAVPILDNRSLLFKNAPHAWHGVKPLNCPEGEYRKLFTIVFERCTPRHPLQALKSKAKTALRRAQKYLIPT